jgi:hypothetical protein
MQEVRAYSAKGSLSKYQIRTVAVRSWGMKGSHSSYPLAGRERAKRLVVALGSSGDVVRSLSGAVACNSLRRQQHHSRALRLDHFANSETAMIEGQERITADSLIPDVLRAWPHARGVLDRYGLRGCGGTLGPVETLSFFARAHDVPLASLLADLRSAATSPSPSVSPGTSADAIYRPFFKAGIVIALTLGAVWGAYLLLKIAYTGTFHAAGLHEVNAHGHAQIFGWVGLFVMGFAYQAFPRFKHTNLSHPQAGVRQPVVDARRTCGPLCVRAAGGIA